MLNRLSWLVIATLLLWSGAPSDAEALTETNLQLAVGADLKQSGTVCVFVVSERGQGMDFNGDGDALDGVIHTHDAQTGLTTNLGWAVGSGYDLDGRFLAVAVSESGQGSQDLNGDGDFNDSVLFLYDLLTGSHINRRLAVDAVLVKGELVALTVPEADQDNMDLNGDGDTLDRVLHLQRALTGVTRNVGFDAEIETSWFRWSRRFVAFVVDEGAQGAADLNLDGDTGDLVVHVHDVLVDVTRNTRRAGHSPQFSGDFVAFPRQLDLYGRLVVFAVSEADQGNTDLNGDGDAIDLVPHVADPVAQTRTNLGAAGAPVDATSRHVVYSVDETQNGAMDANGDGDAFDMEVYHVWDSQTGATQLLGHGLSACLAPGPRVVFAPFEVFADLNGDGDQSDFVLASYHLTTGALTNTGMAIEPFTSFGVGNRFVAFVGRESAQGGTDFNGDGDAADGVVMAMELSTGLVTNSTRATALFGVGPPLLSRGRFVLATVSELWSGQDINGDGDAFDDIFFGFDAVTGAAPIFGHAIYPSAGRPYAIVPGAIFVAASESLGGGVDLNLDGDATDDVIFVLD